MDINTLPSVNATLNATSAVLLTTGYFCIRRRMIRAHAACMVCAFATSTAFLACYITFHAVVGTVHFMGEGWIRPVYLSILATHTVLAVLVVPLAIMTLTRAARRRFELHRKIARWTLPIWLYVSVTGVVIYVLLYHTTGRS